MLPRSRVLRRRPVTSPGGATALTLPRLPGVGALPTVAHGSRACGRPDQGSVEFPARVTVEPPVDDISLVQIRLLAVMVMLVALSGVWVVYNLATSPSPPDVKTPMRVAVIGDSYTEGTGVGGTAPGTNWTSRVVPLLRDQGIEVTIRAEGAGGSGYVATGAYNITFKQLVPRVVTRETDLFVVFGSRNDSARAGLEHDAAATYAAARAINPNIKLLVIGPEWIDENVPGAVAEDRDEVRAAAAAAHAQFVDPLAEGWFFGPDHKLIGSDGWHPTDAGHLYMAQKIAPRMAEILSQDEGVSPEDRRAGG